IVRATRWFRGPGTDLADPRGPAEAHFCRLPASSIGTDSKRIFMRFDPLAHRWWLAVATSAAVAAHSPEASAQAAPAPAAAPAPPVIRAYAWIKPTVIVQASPVESFSQPNMIAATAAGNPV